MPYARRTWTINELVRLLSNPVSAPSGPAAHSAKHGVEGELASHPLFQKARVEAHVYDGRKSDLNASYHEKNPDGTWVHSNSQRKQHPLPSPEVGRHSTMSALDMATALMRAFNTAQMQPHLATLDGGSDMKVNVNFNLPIGNGLAHRTGHGTANVGVRSLFVYCKPNPGNADLPIFQTVVPKDQLAGPGGSTPLVTV
ncbi:hypothetical protein FHY55_08180 [Oceanicola sp. D3]|uniref:hypothetical protein n=1 Tax=Oceanicola sp. D3 TaxID=2587163 RepID=UPI00111D328B|nr:hypothetical protein [Oceanicola sp. D3]QDC09217.1 hypothetical protein FHY55_08180 [Oceanicola sp. D3]